MEFIIWNSHLDLSREGVHDFCQNYAVNFGKTPAELESMSLLNLAAIYMDAKRSADLRCAKHILNHELGAPIIVFTDNAELVGRKSGYRLLDSENLKDIFTCRVGLTTKFFTDGSELRCDDLTMDGMNHYIFRQITDPRALGLFLSNFPTHPGLPQKEELDRFSISLAPVVDKFYGRNQSRSHEATKKINGPEKQLQR